MLSNSAITKGSTLCFLIIFHIFLTVIRCQKENKEFYSHSIEKSDKIISLQQEFRTFLKKYQSNSCILEIFSNFSHQCEEIDDRTNSILAYKMTMCIYSSIKKETKFECKIEEKLECIKLLEGDLWTTFITFSHHIDNLCFFYKTLLFEKSSEFLFFKLLNSSMSVLEELSKSHNIAEKMISSQEKFSSQIEHNLSETLENFNSIYKFFENYTRLEEKLKENVSELEMRINSNSQKMSSIMKYVDEKIEMLRVFYDFFQTGGDFNFSNALYYFLSLSMLVTLLATLKFLKGIKIYLNFLIIFFFLFEKYCLPQIYSSSSLGVLYYYILFYCCRVGYFILILIIILVKWWNWKEGKGEYNQLEGEKFCNKNKNNFSWSDYKTYLNMTPAWVKKYFKKLKMQNESLGEKFRKMNKMMERELMKKDGLDMDLDTTISD